MANNTLINIYKSLPITTRRFLQYGYGLLPLKIRLGTEFFKQLEFLEKSQWWSKEELENYQNQKLRMLIKHAFENVPYYNKIFKSSKLKPEDIKTIRDLPKLPLLEKNTVRHNLESFIAKNYNRKDLCYITTSGTTGNILNLYSDPTIEFINGGPFEWRFYRWGGYNFDDYCAVFRAQFLKYKKFGKERFFKFNPLSKKLVFFINDLDEQHIQIYIDSLKKFPIKVINGYPSQLVLFMNILKKKGHSCPLNLKAIFTISELLSTEQRESIEAYFGCKVFDWYGMQERVIIACECEQHSGHHMNSEYGIVEFINGNLDKNSKEIVATGLINYAMPLIRYKTEDIGIPIKNKCICGRGLPLLKLLGGRTRNFIVDSEENLKYVIIPFYKFSDFIKQYQFVQKENGQIDVKIVIKANYSFKEEKLLRNELIARLGGKFIFNIMPVERIEPTSNGKTPLVLLKQAYPQNKLV